MRRQGSGPGLMLIPFLITAAILFGGIAWSVTSYFGHGYDGRMSESQLLARAAIECFKRVGALEGAAFASQCGLAYDVISKDHLIRIEKVSDGTPVVEIGVGDYRNQCAFSGGRLNANYPRCVNGTFVQGENYRYIVGSNQMVRRNG